MFVLFAIALSQTTNKIVQFGEYESIEGLTSSNNYVSIIVRKTEPPFTKSAILFNNDGDMLLRFENADGLRYMLAEPIESYGYFVTVNRGGEYESDLIQAFDISTGQKIWTTNLTACSYELSPNKTYMITSGNPTSDKSGIFEIINLKNGNKVDFDKKFDQYRAAWLDDNRIIFIFQEWEKNIIKNGTKDSSFYYKTEMMNIRNESFTNKNLLEKGLMTQSDHDKRKKDLEMRKAEIEKKITELRRANEGRVHGVRSIQNPKTIRIAIYDMTLKSIIKEKYLYKDDGSKISIGVTPSTSNTINVDKEKNIYIYCHEYVEHNIIYYMVKFSKDLDFIWTTKKPIGNIKVYYIDSDIYFKSSLRDDINIIDINTGNLVPYNKVEAEVNLNSEIRVSKIKIINNLIIDSSGKKLTFIKGEGDK